MSNDALSLSAQLEALQRQIAALTPPAAPAAGKPEEELPMGTQFTSIGFVASGISESRPSEGSLYRIPTKAGKVKTVRLVSDVTDIIGLFVANAPAGSWHFTYRDLKKGEPVS